jgi:glucose/arabinose dehydrogenase
MSTELEDRSADVTVTAWSEDSFEATGMRFLPDGRSLVITKGGWQGEGQGEVVLLDAEGKTLDSVLKVPVCTDAERGLLGIEVSPTFDEDQFIYLYYTRQMNGCPVSDIGELVGDDEAVFSRLSRIKFDASGMSIDDEEVLLDEIPAHQSSHVAGDLAFLADGSLLVATGEATLARSADPTYLDGKILRIDVDDPNTPLVDNPFIEESFPAGLVYATGFRNPFRIAVDPDTQSVIAADVGTDDFEELNVVLAGRDYGFPQVEGDRSVDGSERPYLTYQHQTADCGAIIGGEFVGRGTLGQNEGPTVLFHDMVCLELWAVELTDPPTEAVRLGRSAVPLSDIIVGPDGRAYLVPIGVGPISAMDLGDLGA